MLDTLFYNVLAICGGKLATVWTNHEYTRKYLMGYNNSG